MSEEQARPAGAARRLQRLCDLSAATGGLVLVAIALTTVVSVVGRAWFAHPLLGDVELVQLGCAVVVSCFLPYTQLHRANIIVDFFTTRAGVPVQQALDRFGVLLYTLVMALVLWRVAVGAIDMHANGEASMLMNLPLWWPYALMLPGLALCVLIGAWQLAGGAAQPGAEERP